MMESTDDKICMITEDGIEMQVDPRLVELCLDIKLFYEIGAEGAPIPVLVSSAIIKQIIEYCEHYNYKLPTEDKNISSKVVYPKVYKKTKPHDLINEWDKEFLMRHGHKGFFEILMAANKLNMEQTLYRTCIKFFAGMIQGKTAVEIGKLMRPAMEEFGCFKDEPNLNLEETASASCSSLASEVSTISETTSTSETTTSDD